MKTIRKYSKFIPFIYYIIIMAFWFTEVNKSEGITAFPILLFGLPFVWMLIKPNDKLNFSLGIIFVCLSSYLMLAYLSDLFHIITLSESAKRLLFFGGLLVVMNLIMALWMIRNSLKRSF